MAERIPLVQGDTRPALLVTIKDNVTEEPVNLTGVTPRLKFRRFEDVVVLATLVGSVVDPLGGQCVFHPGTAPEMLADWGDFQGEIELTFEDGSIQTVYDLLRFRVREEF